MGNATRRVVLPLTFLKEDVNHIGPLVGVHAGNKDRTLGRFSPGLITAVLFFIPVGIATFWTAWTTGIACAGEIGLSLLIVRQLMNKITPGYVPTKIELPDARNAYRAVEDAVYYMDSNLKLL